MQNWSYVWTILEQLREYLRCRGRREVLTGCTENSAKGTEEEGPEPVPQLVRLAYKEVEGGDDERPTEEGTSEQQR